MKDYLAMSVLPPHTQAGAVQWYCEVPISAIPGFHLRLRCVVHFFA